MTARGVPSASWKEWNAPIFSFHRTLAPQGLMGGDAGQVGRTEVRRNDGSVETLKGSDQTVVEAGEAVIVTTPTGGGFGAS